jgi:mRNA interferase MazF
MNRGDIVTVSLPGNYGKPRPALIVQSNFFDRHPSLTILPITTELRDTPLFRVTVKPDEENGLRQLSQVMVDKAHTVPREKLSIPFGRLSAASMLVVNRALAIFLGIT